MRPKNNHHPAAAGWLFISSPVYNKLNMQMCVYDRAWMDQYLLPAAFLQYLHSLSMQQHAKLYLPVYSVETEGKELELKHINKRLSMPIATNLLNVQYLPAGLVLCLAVSVALPRCLHKAKKKGGGPHEKVEIAFLYSNYSMESTFRPGQLEIPISLKACEN